MSSKKPVRQDFIAKARYINSLPPPPVNPKFIKTNTTETLSREEETDQILSSLFRKENFKRLLENVDEEFGMPLNLINNKGVLDNNDVKSITRTKDYSGELHPNDRILLRDAGIGRITRKEPEVSFLRRTEYISENRISRNVDVEETKKVEEKFDSETQLKAVERTFDLAQESLTNFKDLKHPTKKYLKPVKAWQLFPDTSMMDAKFMTVKFNGSASFKRQLDTLKRQNPSSFDEEVQKKVLSTSVLRPITSEDGEWMTLYQSTGEEVESLHNELNSLEPNKPNNSESKDFNFKLSRNYDMNFTKFKPFEELSVKFDKKRKLANYYPVNGRIDLKKYRTSTNSQINKFVNESTFDGVNFSLREPTTDELRKMDNIRSEFDPMEYEGEEEKEETRDEKESTEENEDKQE